MSFRSDPFRSFCGISRAQDKIFRLYKKIEKSIAILRCAAQRNLKVSLRIRTVLAPAVTEASLAAEVAGHERVIEVALVRVTDRAHFERRLRACNLQRTF